MSLASIIDEFIPSHVNGPHRYRRRARPVLSSILDTLEDQMDQQVGYVFRRFPSILMDAEDSGSVPKRRRLDRKATNAEPKSRADVSTKDNRFKIQMCTSSFTPDEISVKVVEDKIVLSAKHESKGDDVYEFHELYRTFIIPEGVNPDNITSRLSANGQLTIEAPMKAVRDGPEERTVAIVREEQEEKPTTEQAVAKDVEDK